MEIAEKYKKILLDIVLKKLPNCKVYLFGSRATKTSHAGSDIDLAIEAKTKIDMGTIGNIKEEIENSNIPFFVDIVDINNVSTEMKKQILKDSILWND